MKLAAFACFFMCSLACKAQSDSIVYLDEVEVLGTPLSKYSAGTSISNITLDGSGSLAEIGNQSTINFKIYGNGQLATISLRGTSASHTNVIWNGLPVNSPTLGQTDFSVWPSFLNDQVVIQKGSTSSLFGSGSIGGNVILENSQVKKDSLITLKLGYGSFGERNLGLKTQLSASDRLTFETRFFTSEIENDFPYLFDGGEVRQPHAGVKRLGASQKVRADLGNHQFFAEVAFASNDREIQPTVTSSSRDQLETKSLRALVSDEVLIGDVILYSSLGFTRESTAFNDTSNTSSTQHIANVSADFPISKSIENKTGGTYILTSGRSDNYQGLQMDHQYHLFSSFNFGLGRHAQITVNLREAIHESKAVFVPSIGGKWSIGNPNAQVTARGQISRGYRVPTFNDRFWRPGGNPDLLPELSLNREIGFDIEVLPIFQFSVTAYRSSVDQWIQWQPIGGVWTPRNIREVKVRGLELMSKWKLHSSQNFKVELKNEYEYTRSSDEGREEENQLPYVPKHAFSSNLKLDGSIGSVTFRGNYTGERFANLSNSRQSSIDDFFLADIIIGRHFQTKAFTGIVNSSVNNILNQSYQNLKNTAMPGRNYLIQLTIKY